MKPKKRSPRAQSIDPTTQLALKRELGTGCANDYILKPGQHSVWIEVDSILVHIFRSGGDRGVEVALYAKGSDLDYALNRASAAFCEAADEAKVHPVV